MKKFLSVLLVLTILVSSCATLSSCSDDDDSSNKVMLTTVNYSQYLDITAKMFGEGPSWNSYRDRYEYSKIRCTAEVNATSPYLQFYDCTIKIKVKGSYNNYNKFVDETLTIRLSLGGTGSDSTTVYPSSNAYNIVPKTYEVVSITGYVVLR